MSDLRSNLIRVASTFPVGNPNRVAILNMLREHDDVSVKTAASPETEAFIAWVIATQKKMTPDQVQRFLEQKLGREPVEAVERAPAKRGPLEKGETVLVNALNNTNALNVDACKDYHNRVGFIDDIGSDGVTVAFYKGDAENPSDIPSGDKQFFDGKETGKKTGLYRWTSRAQHQERSVEKRIGFEVIYFAEKPTVDKRSLEQIQEYVEKGVDKGESRSRAYYSGQVGVFTYNKSGEMYFSLVAQQRDRPTFINPSKGQLLYIGIMGHRPAGWMKDATEMMERELAEKQEEAAAE
jgi:hypothetical protein